jgi:hypothetical protein
MLLRVLLAELTPVNPRPLLVNRLELAPVKLQFLSLNVSGRNLHMHMRVVRVSVDGGNHFGLRETLLEVTIDHLFGFLI